MPTEKFTMRLKNGKSYEAMLPRNTFSKGNVPVILVPSDVLRDLPVATDWQDVSSAASQSAEIRNRVNDQIAAAMAKQNTEGQRGSPNLGSRR